MTGRFFTPLATGLAILVFIFGHLGLQPLLAKARLDFTEGRLYSLSPATRATVSGISEPIDLTFVYSNTTAQDYPQIRAYGARVRELLDAYRALGGGRLRIREIDPAPFSEAEDNALAAGITALGEDPANPLYFGLIGRNAVDDEIVIPFLSPDRDASLEYDLTRLISRLDKPAPARIGVVSTLAGFTGDGDGTGYVVLRELAKLHRIVPIPADFVQMPEDIDALVVIHPTGFNRRQWYLIDQFLLRNGRAVFCVDPASKAAAFSLGRGGTASDLGPLEGTLGVRLLDGAVADASTALPVNVDAGNGRIQQVGHPLFLGLLPDHLSPDDIVTATLSRTINFGAPGALEASALPLGAEITSLAWTGPAPALVNAADAAQDMQPTSVLAEYVPRDAALTLAMRWRGPLESAFEGPVAPVPTGDSVADELAEIAAANDVAHRDRSETDANIILLADTDVLVDGFFIDPASGTAVGDNGVFLLNAVDSLIGGNGLTRLRSRTGSLRPMTRVADMRAAAEEQYFAEQQRLQGRLSRALDRLAELQAATETGGVFTGDLQSQLTADERAELNKLRGDVVDTRARLRVIERDFRSEIDGLEGWLAALNIWLGPLIAALVGVWVAVMRTRRRA